MTTLPPFDTWLWTQALTETLWAGLDPAGAGRYLRERRLARLLARTQAVSPLYHQRNPAARCLADFTPVSKAELMAHFDNWATDRRIKLKQARLFVSEPEHVGNGWLDDYLLWTSSGTSGEPGIFVQDAGSLAAFDAIDALRLRGSQASTYQLGIWGMGQRFAFVGAIGGHFAGHVSMQRLRRLMPSTSIASFSVLDPLPVVAVRLQEQKPTVLITYPSCAAALAQLQLDGELSLSLLELWMGGEQLSPQQQQLIQAAFRCPLRNNYGASEFYSIASACDHGCLHVNDDWVILEPVDAHMQPVPVGTLSDSVLLTNLANLTQPLVRYRLMDRVRLTGVPCTCGNAFPVIEVQGRADDTLHLRGVGRRRVTILPLALETVIEERAGVSRFQLLCRSDAHIEIRFEAAVSAAAQAFERTRQVLAEFLGQQGVTGARFVYSSEPPLLKPHSGKLLRVLQLS